MMDVTLEQRHLAHALAMVAPAVGDDRRGSPPAASHVLLAVEHGRVMVAACDATTRITVWLGAATAGDGTALLPHRLLDNVVSALPDEPVRLSRCDDAHAVAVTCGRSWSTLRGLDPATFPSAPSSAGDCIATLGARALKDAIPAVVFAADDRTGARNPAYAGVLATFSGDALTFAACDGFRLALRAVGLAAGGREETSVIIPAHTLRNLARILPDGDEVDVVLASSRSLIVFRTPVVEMMAHLIAGTYVDYARVIPTETATTAVVARADLVQALSSIRRFARVGRSSFDMVASPSRAELTLRAEAADLGSNEATIPALVRGDELALLLNTRYVSEAVAAVAAEQLVLSFSGSRSPCTIAPHGDGSALHVLMPAAPAPAP